MALFFISGFLFKISIFKHLIPTTILSVTFCIAFNLKRYRHSDPFLLSSTSLNYGIARFLTTVALGVVISSTTAQNVSISFPIYKAGQHRSCSILRVDKTAKRSSQLSKNFTSLISFLEGRYEDRVENSELNSKTKLLLLSLVLGKREVLPYRIVDTYRYIGIAHMLALSGLHMGILALLLMRSLKYIISNETVRYFVILILLFVYLAIVSFPPSLVRAFTLFFIYIFLKLSGRKASLQESLFVTATLILFISPSTIQSVSFLLSFLAVLGIAVIGLPLMRKVDSVIKGPFCGKILKALSHSVIITISVQLVTLPVVLTYFSRMPLVSPLSNILLMIPLVLFLYIGTAFVFLPLRALDFLLVPILNRIGWILWDIPLRIAGSPQPAILRGNVNVTLYLMFLLIVIVRRWVGRRADRTLICLSIILIATSFIAGRCSGDRNLKTCVEEAVGKHMTLVYNSQVKLLVVRRMDKLRLTGEVIRSLWDRGIWKLNAVFIEDSDKWAGTYFEFFSKRVKVEKLFCSRYLYLVNSNDIKAVKRARIEVVPLSKGDKVSIGGISVEVQNPTFPPEKAILTENETRLKLSMNCTEKVD